MPSNVFSSFPDSLSVFKNEASLYADFLPDRLPCRENEIQTLALGLRPLIKARKAENFFLFGLPGTGKTAISKFVLKELQEFSSRAKSLYLNCFEYNSRHLVLAALASFMKCAVPKRGMSSEEIFESVQESLRKSDFYPILVLDEADQLMHTGNASTLLYELLRLPVAHAPVIILISNNPLLLSQLDDRVRSSFFNSSIEFKSYTPIQLKTILKERVQFAFRENSVDAEVINVAAGFAAKNNGDARIAIEAILKAGRQAERENSEKVLLTHLQKILPDISARQIARAEKSLDPIDKQVLELLSKLQPCHSGILFEQYCLLVKKPLTERQFRSRLNRLAGMHLISLEEKKLEKRGKTREVKLAIPIEQLTLLL
ncbi:MAG: AAA family ATPase [Candidatus Diapherotrites archaeon]|nr:AAA family ATPase [Candidatus Diapherotrites archaeon]